MRYNLAPGTTKVKLFFTVSDGTPLLLVIENANQEKVTFV